MVLNECLFSYGALAHSVFKISFQPDLLMRFLVIFKGFELWFFHALLQSISGYGELQFDMGSGFCSKEKLFTLLWSVNPDLKWYVMHVLQRILFIFDTLFYGCSHYPRVILII